MKKVLVAVMALGLIFSAGAATTASAEEKETTGFTTFQDPGNGGH